MESNTHNKREKLMWSQAQSSKLPVTGGEDQVMKTVIECKGDIQGNDWILPLEKYDDIGSLDNISFEKDLTEFLFVNSTEFMNEEETLDCEEIKVEEQYWTPVCPRGPPSRGLSPGPYNFEVAINAADVKRKYMYSHKLNRVYVDIHQNFSVQFKWDFTKTPQQPLIVRATTAFSDESQFGNRVERCLQHRHENSVPNIQLHVLRSSRPPGSEDVHYCGNPDDIHSWFSVLVVCKYRPEDGNTAFTHAYTFVCKSSCNSGINRRPIELIFTLETLSGEVLGRQSVGVRVCSCPRRDMKKDEDDELKKGGKKRKTEESSDASVVGALAVGKRIKTEFDDRRLYNLQIPLVGRKNCEDVLNMAIKYMTADRSREHNPEMALLYEYPIKETQKLLDKLNDGTL